MKTTDTHLWSDVADTIDEAILVAWDGCHKIYLALDEPEAEFFRTNYPHIVEDTPTVMFTTVVDWYDRSCGLRFVSGVRYNPDDPNAGFSQLITQFDLRDPEYDFDEDEEDDDDE